MGVQYCQITKPSCLCGKWQIWVTKVKTIWKSWGGLKPPPPDYHCLRYTVSVSQDGDRSLWQWQMMTIYSGGDNPTIRLWGHNRKISLHMVVRRIAKCWWIIATFLIGNDLWKYKVAYLLRPSKPPPPPPPPSPTWQSGQQILELAWHIALMTSALVILTSES